MAICANKPSAKPARTGFCESWIHVLRYDTPLSPARAKPKAETPKLTIERASDERCADVYRALIREQLVLSKQHRAKLLERGLPSGIVMANGYASTPTKAFGANVARALAQEYDLTGVPGFYRVGDQWRMVDVGSGFYIPVRSSDGLIQGFQIRRDEGEPKYIWLSSANRDGGASSGSPLHYANHLLMPDASEVWLTEGILKSDIAGHFLNAPVIAAAGVSCFGQDFAANLKQQFPKLKTCVVAFDTDWRTKPQVKVALDKLIAQLSAVGLRVVVRTWRAEFGKGIDDYLLHLAQADRRAA
jgi:hypothetical protein